MRIGGVVDAVQVEAYDSTVSEVLAALGAAFDVTFRNSPKLDHRISGTFQGSLFQVLSRLLEQHNFVVKRSASGSIEVLYVGVKAHGEQARPSVRHPAEAATVARPDAFVPAAPSPNHETNGASNAAEPSFAEMLRKRCRILPASCR